MAIPLIIGIAAGAVGLYKGGKAIIDNNAASDINDAADEIVQKANKRLETTRSACQSALEDLGKHKHWKKTCGIFCIPLTKSKMWISPMMATSTIWRCAISTPPS